ncbi:hypothetical protein ACFQY8_07695 [Alloscardovia venturai]|uniref:Uncharacterized protein n=1 Tax=Alloscardovia venturai TaxID=1769421 RepID=A0ABW2Y5S9_9BIFI
MDVNLRPDYSWASDELALFVGGIIAISLTVMVIALITGALRFFLAKVTDSKWDDAIGDRILISVLIASFVIGSLGGLVGYEMGLWNDNPVTVSASGNAALTMEEKAEVTHDARVAQGYKDADETNKYADKKAKDAQNKFNKGDIAGAASDATQSLANRVKSGAQKVGTWVADQAWNANKKLKEFFHIQ